MYCTPDPRRILHARARGTPCSIGKASNARATGVSCALSEGFAEGPGATVQHRTPPATIERSHATNGAHLLRYGRHSVLSMPVQKKAARGLR